MNLAGMKNFLLQDGKFLQATRPKGRSSRTAEELRRRGAEVLELPSIGTVPLEDQSTLVHAFEEISSYQWIVFTSPTGVEMFFDELKKAHKDIRSLAGAQIAAIESGHGKSSGRQGHSC